MQTHRSVLASCRSGRCTSVSSQITSRLARCQLAKVPQQGQRPRTSEGVALALQHRGATSSDTAESALSRPMWKIRDCGSKIAIRFDLMEAPIEVQYELPTSLSHLKDFQQGQCAVRNQPCLANVTLSHMWILGALAWFVGSASIGHKSSKRGGVMCCHQFLHFKRSTGHRLYLQSPISSSEQTGADMLHYRCPPSRLSLTPVNSVKMNEMSQRFTRMALCFRISNAEDE